MGFRRRLWLESLRSGIDVALSGAIEQNIYGDLIFHLGGAIRFTQPGPQGKARSNRASLLNMIRQHGWRSVLRRAGMKAIPRPIAQRIQPEYYETPQQVLARATSQLLSNPEAFLDRLRH